ncbi:MAG: Isopentenyl-diphosphate Delta-isomerase [Candidatus Celerinatantimonas neptuna]|nr:MAG: Isopentenyl-diphosphate Delta-isomerase [Candidatus Celerinatantimonas neptuna]
MSCETVILLDQANKPIGEMDKLAVHHHQTPLHLAFSCYILNEQGKLLVTRRALTKQAWPGVWTNSVCGHPAQGEVIEDAVYRRADFELGMQISHPRLRVDEFSYYATDASGVVENEFCPIFSAVSLSEIVPNPEEVMDYQWVSPEKLNRSVDDIPWAFSPWMVEQIKALRECGVWPLNV